MLQDKVNASRNRDLKALPYQYLLNFVSEHLSVRLFENVDVKEKEYFAVKDAKERQFDKQMFVDKNPFWAIVAGDLPMPKAVEVKDT